MTRLFVSANISEVLLLKSLIENEGIETFIRNEHLSIASGAVPFTECMPELWVSESDFAAANAVMGRWQNGAEDELEAWAPRAARKSRRSSASVGNAGRSGTARTSFESEPPAPLATLKPNCRTRFSI